jgi:Xaa-Pro dipeptidase
MEAFAEIARRIRAGETTTEYDIQQFIVRRFEEEGMTCGRPPHVSVGANTANPHYQPDAEKRAHPRGDFVLFDVWRS